MSADMKWRREVRAMAESEGLTVERMARSSRGRIACCVSLSGYLATATVAGSAGRHRTPMETRACFRRVARSLKDAARACRSVAA
ncbi:hypothetical protein GXB84_06695 [Stenotrophomonas acidaminiphila]|uniref:hypothetical protein n=1 Tax=Stenotrophomonas TaxID=40323 RepID=UPI000AA58227|nr:MULTISPECIES: hypothetical protein [Stenotrophomonas]NCT87017.1 hypothetical protein [Stenotrophomonas acidaminiphila]